MVLNRAQMSLRPAAQFIRSEIGCEVGLASSLDARPGADRSRRQRAGRWRWLGGTLLLTGLALPSAWAQAPAVAPAKVESSKAAPAEPSKAAAAKSEPSKAAPAEPSK